MERQKMTSSVKMKIHQLREVLDRALKSGTNDIQSLSQLLKTLWQILEQIDCNEVVQSLGEYEIDGLLRILDMVNVHRLTNHILEQESQLQSTSTSNEEVYANSVVDTEGSGVAIQDEPQLGLTTNQLLEQTVRYQYESTNVSSETVHKSSDIDSDSPRDYNQDEPQFGSTSNHLLDQEDQEISATQSNETVHEGYVVDAESRLDIEDEPQSDPSEQVEIRIRIYVESTEVTSEMYQNSSNGGVEEEESDTDIAAKNVIREEIYDEMQNIKALHVLEILRTMEAEEKIYFPHQIRLYNIVDFIESLCYNDLIFLLERIKLEQTVCQSIEPYLKNRKRLADTEAYDSDFASKKRKIAEEIEHIESDAANENEIAETTNEATQDSISSDSEEQNEDTPSVIEVYFEGIDEVLHCIGGQYSDQDVVNLIEMIKSEFFLNNNCGSNDTANDLSQESYNDLLEKFTLGDIIRLKDRIIEGCISTNNPEENIETLEDASSDSSDDTAYHNLMNRDFNDESTDDISLTDMKKFIDEIYIENLPKAGTVGKYSKQDKHKLCATDAVRCSPTEKLSPIGKKLFEEPVQESEVHLPNSSCLLEEHQSNEALGLENDSEGKGQPNEGDNEKEKSALELDEYHSTTKDNAIGDYQHKGTTFSDFMDNIEECDPESLDINNLLKMFLENKQSFGSSEKNECSVWHLAVIPECDENELDEENPLIPIQQGNDEQVIDVHGLEVIPESDLENEVDNLESESQGEDNRLISIYESPDIALKDIDELISDSYHTPVQENVKNIQTGQLTDADKESEKQINDIRHSLINATNTQLKETTNNGSKDASSNYLTNPTQVEEGEASNNFIDVRNIDNLEDLSDEVKENIIGSFLSMIVSTYPGLIPLDNDSNIPEPAETESPILDQDLLEATQKEKYVDHKSSLSDSEDENGPRRVVTADGVLDLDADHSSSCVESWEILPDLSSLNLDDELFINNSCHKDDVNEIKSSNLVEEFTSIEICHMTLSRFSANPTYVEQQDMAHVSLSSGLASENDNLTYYAEEQEICHVSLSRASASVIENLTRLEEQDKSHTSLSNGSAANLTHVEEQNISHISLSSGLASENDNLTYYAEEQEICHVSLSRASAFVIEDLTRLEEQDKSHISLSNGSAANLTHVEEQDTSHISLSSGLASEAANLTRVEEQDVDPISLSNGSNSEATSPTLVKEQDIDHISLSRGSNSEAGSPTHVKEQDVDPISLSRCSNSQAASPTHIKEQTADNIPTSSGSDRTTVAEELQPHPNASVSSDAMNTPRREHLQTFQTELSDAILDLRNHIRRRLEDLD